MGIQPGLGALFVGPLLLGLACPGSQDRSRRSPATVSKSSDAKENAAPAPPAARRPPRFSLDPQPLFRTSPSRTGLVVGPIPREAPAIRWRFQAGRPFHASPILDAEGVTYIGSLDRVFYAIDWQGQPRWRQAFGDRIYASAALVRGGIVIGADDDHVRFLDREGKVRWSLPLGACAAGPRHQGRGPENVRCDADASPVVTPDGTILVGGDALHALTPDGRLRWRLETGGHVRSSPALGPDGTIYVGVQGGAVLAVGPEGKKRWEHREPYDFDGTPALTADGLVVVGCDDGRLHALELRDGGVRFRVATRGPVRGSPAVAGDGSILFGSDDGLLRAVTSRGTPRWSFASGGPIRSSPAVDRSGAVVFGSQDNGLYALSAEGKLLWRVELGGDVDSSVAVAPDGTLIVGADDGVLYALGS